MNSRSSDPVTTYFIEAIQNEEVVVGADTIMLTSMGNEITYDLSVLNLNMEQSYNVCVKANNIIGNSSAGCDVFVYMDTPTEGTVHIYHTTHIALVL